MDPNTWASVTKVDLTSIANPNANPVQVLPDGLSMAHVGGLAAKPVPLLSTRSDRSQPFGSPQTLPGWGTGLPTVEDLWTHLSGNELIVTMDSAGKNALFLTSLGAGVYNPPVDMGPQVNVSGFDSSRATVTADGQLAIFTRNDGAFSSPLNRTLYRLYQMSRTPPVTPGSSFSSPVNIVIAQIPSQEDMTCPALAPDGKFLFFGSTYPILTNGTFSDLTHATSVYFATRSPPGWATPVQLEKLSDPSLHTCPVSVTADGCELYLRRFSSVVDATEIWVAKRTP